MIMKQFRCFRCSVLLWFFSVILSYGKFLFKLIGFAIDATFNMVTCVRLPKLLEKYNMIAFQLKLYHQTIVYVTKASFQNVVNTFSLFWQKKK